LLRAAQLAPEEGFDEAATAAAKLFRAPADENGLLRTEGGLASFAVHPRAQRPHVLSGFATGVLGLHEYGRVRGEPWVDDLLARCLRSLGVVARHLHPDPPDVAPAPPPDPEYTVVQQLSALHRITGDERFGEAARIRARALHKARLRAFLRLEAPI
jgi:hypothetical protein